MIERANAQADQKMTLADVSPACGGSEQERGTTLTMVDACSTSSCSCSLVGIKRYGFLSCVILTRLSFAGGVLALIAFMCGIGGEPTPAKLSPNFDVLTVYCTGLFIWWFVVREGAYFAVSATEPLV